MHVVTKGATLTGSAPALIDKPHPAVAIVNAPSPEAGAGATITGKVSGYCGSPIVTLTSAGASTPVTAQVAADGTWSARPIFDKAYATGPLSVTASVNQDANNHTTLAYFTVSVLPETLVATVTGLPVDMNAGQTANVHIQFNRSSGNDPIPAQQYNVVLGKWNACMNVGGGGGINCTVSVPLLLDDSLAGSHASIAVTPQGPYPAAITVAGTSQTMLLTRNGWVVRKLNASFIDPVIQGLRPGGVLLHNLNQGMGSKEASDCVKCSWIYLDPSLSPKFGTAFDLPYFGSNPWFFYANYVLIKTDPLTFQAPANITIPLEVSGVNGEGPSIEGKCWRDLSCAAVPAFRNLSLVDANIQIQFVVANGAIVARLLSAQAQIAFDCKGIAKSDCGGLQSFINSNLQNALDQLVANPQVKGQLAAVAKPLNDLAHQSMSSVGQVVVTSGGDIILKGPPTAGN